MADNELAALADFIDDPELPGVKIPNPEKRKRQAAAAEEKRLEGLPWYGKLMEAYKAIGSNPENLKMPFQDSLVDNISKRMDAGASGAAWGGGAMGAIPGLISPPSSLGEFASNTVSNRLPLGKTEDAISGMGGIAKTLARWGIGTGTGAGLSSMQKSMDEGSLQPPDLASSLLGGFTHAGALGIGDRIKLSTKAKELGARAKVENFVGDSVELPGVVQKGAAEAATAPLTLEARNQALKSSYAKEKIGNIQLAQKELAGATVSNNQAVDKAHEGMLSQKIQLTGQIRNNSTTLKFLRKGLDANGEPLDASAPSKLGKPPIVKEPDPLKIFDLVYPRVGTQMLDGSIREPNPLPPIVRDRLEEIMSRGVSPADALKLLHQTANPQMERQVVEPVLSVYQTAFKKAQDMAKKQQATYALARKREITDYRASQSSNIEKQSQALATQKDELEQAQLTYVAKKLKGAETDPSLRAAIGNINVGEKYGAQLGVDLQKARNELNLIKDGIEEVSGSGGALQRPILNRVLGNNFKDGTPDKILGRIYELPENDLKDLMDATAKKPELQDAVKNSYLSRLFSNGYDYKANRFDFGKLNSETSFTKLETLYGKDFANGFSEFLNGVQEFQKHQDINKSMDSIGGKVKNLAAAAGGMGTLGIGSLATGFLFRHPAIAAAEGGAALATIPYNQTLWNFLLRNKDAGSQWFKWAQGGGTQDGLKAYPIVQALIKEVGSTVSDAAHKMAPSTPSVNEAPPPAP